MQAIAAELALPTTAFLVPESDDVCRIRWFTPRSELAVCGHATVASACVLYERLGVPEPTRLTFVTVGGPLYAHRAGEFVSVDLPRVDVAEWAPPRALRAAIGAPIVHCARAADDVVIELESARAVAGIAPDFAALAGIDCRGHVVTARSPEPDTDFVSRSFFPALGVDEDQVCVSAHCKLAPYWGTRLGRRVMSASQVSQRGGRLRVEMAGDRVLVAGPARLRESVVVV